jgi:hypothetical protein
MEAAHFRALLTEFGNALRPETAENPAKPGLSLLSSQDI